MMACREKSMVMMMKIYTRMSCERAIHIHERERERREEKSQD